MKPWKPLLTVVLVFGVSLPALIQAQQRKAQAQEGSQREVLPTQPAIGEVLTFRELKIRLTVAQKEGYRVAVQEEACDILKWPKGCPTKVARVNVVKEGKTQEAYGVLGIRWDQRETWEIIFVREGDKFKLVAAEGVREQKAPVAGTWRQTAKLAGLPGPLQSGDSQ